jgi:hypothetical protein
VLQKTSRKSLWLVVVIAASCSAAWSKVPVLKGLPVTLSVHNDAGVPLGVLLQAESEASRIFRQSGLEIRWLNCPLPQVASENPSECATAGFPWHLQLRIVSHSLNLNEFAMGISYLSADGTGCYADLFYHRAQQIHETSQINVAIILGHGLAHELGHLLLGTNSHAPTGIMRARWQPTDLANASQGRLLFSPLESREMRNKLAASHPQVLDEPQVVTARLGD